MKLHELLDKAQVSFSSEANPDILGILQDSRKIEKGFLFVCLATTREDKNEYIEDAIQRGAVAVLSNEPMNKSVPVLVSSSVKEDALKLAQVFYAQIPQNLVAVTGTNGKTSTVFFVRQIIEALGSKAGSMGTLGTQSPDYNAYSGMTTTDGLSIYHDLNKMAQTGVEYVAIEASSHGLDQNRLAGLSFKASAFTNLTRDHLDYHGNMENYLKAKMKLFTDLTEKVAVLNADIDVFPTIEKVCIEKGLTVISYGHNGRNIQLLQQDLREDGQNLSFKVNGKDYSVSLPVAGIFQGMNLLAAIGLIMSLGFDIEQIIPALSYIHSPSGRMECVAKAPSGASIFVDYAHTPDGLETALNSLRKHTTGKLWVVFGCGGNRDSGKRPMMGEIAARLADKVIVTDDNPRFEDPSSIRKAILKACPQAQEIGNRANAILKAVRALKAGDDLLIAGKGHEEGQIIRGIVYPFNDKVQAILAVRTLVEKPLWTSEEMKMATGGKSHQAFVAYGLSIDSRTIQAGDLYVALKGEKTDGHIYVEEAIRKGAVAAIVSRDLPEVTDGQRLFFVSNTDLALNDMAVYATENSTARMIGITGSSGKTTTKEIVRKALEGQGNVHATKGNLNNNWGVPLTLACMPRLSDYAVIEMGMNHASELEYLSYLVKPDISLITMIGSAHHEFFKTLEEIAAAKAEIFIHMKKTGTVILNKEDKFFEFLKNKALEQGIKKINSFGKTEDCDYILEKYEETETGSILTIKIKGVEKTIETQMQGEHFAMDIVAALGVVSAVGGNLDKAVQNISGIQPFGGRGQKDTLTYQNKKICVIDDAYNANPSSMEASLRVLGKVAGRKIAVLGDMLELGELSEQFHLKIAQLINENHIDKVFVIGGEMAKMFKTLSPEKQGKSCSDIDELFSALTAEIQEGDTLLLKGSHSMNLTAVLNRFKRGK